MALLVCARLACAQSNRGAWGHGGGGSTGPAAVFGELVTGRVNQRTFLFCFWSVGDSESSVPSSVQDRTQVTGMPKGQLQS